MPPVEIKSVKITKKGLPPEEVMGGKTVNSKGTVSSVSTHHEGKHTTVEIRHGRRKAPKKGKDGEPSPFNWDDRPTSTFSIANEHAAHFPVGAKVNIAMSPAGEEDERDDREDD